MRVSEARIGQFQEVRAYLGGRFVVGVGSSCPHDLRFLTGFFSVVGSGDSWLRLESGEVVLHGEYAVAGVAGVRLLSSSDSSSYSSLFGSSYCVDFPSKSERSNSLEFIASIVEDICLGVRVS